MNTKTNYRTHSCGELRKTNAGQTVTLSGWVNKIREHGNLTFIDIRDRYGITQITAATNLEGFNPREIKKEFVIQITGTVEIKPEPNKVLTTGEIEIKANKIVILNKAKTMPIDIEDAANMTEDTRLKYRYLDLRRKQMQDNLILRHKLMKATRDFFDSEGFIELETPILGKSTPEGARDYLVPSRVSKNNFYALPQSPQIFKQLFMISGFDKYIQIVRCFRDEDLRKDRQPEFTQIDLEMSFVKQDDILEVNERFVKYAMKKVMNVDIQIPFPRITYNDAMNKYGSDKPDFRYDLEFEDVTELAHKTEFNVFKTAECVKCLAVDKEFSRKQIDKLTDLVKIYKAKGLAWFKVTNNGLEGGISKFVAETEFAKKFSVGQTVFFVADKWDVVCDALGSLRQKLAEDMELYDKNEFNFGWVVDFPMFEYNEEHDRWISMHHPFTMPNIEKASDLDVEDMSKIPSSGYDLTLNGVELGGGSVRIHDNEIQQKVFEKLGLTPEETQEKFGFLLDALSYGAPPHAGIAFGLDRFVMLLTRTNSIREVIAFPKTKNAEDLMLDAPSCVAQEQLDELALELQEIKKEPTQ